MKKYFGILATAIAAMSVLSCQRELEPAEGGEDVTLVPMTILSTVDSRTSLELDGDNNPTGHVLWDYGDSISVFDGTANRKFGTSDIPEDGHKYIAAFEGSVAASATEFAAVYPYSAAYGSASYDASSNTLSISIPSLQEVDAPGSYSPAANVCVAYADKDDDEHILVDGTDALAEMVFRNVGGLLKFSISQDGVHKSVTIRTSDASPLTGAIEAVADTGVAEAAEEGSADYVTIAASDGGFLAAGDYYAVVLPFAEKTVSLEFSNGEKSKKRNSKAVISLGRAAMRDLGTIDAGIDYIPGDYLIGNYNDAYWILMNPAFASTIYPSVNTEVDTPFATLSYTEFFTELDTNDYLWHVRKDDNGYYIYHTEGTTNKYLAYSGSSNNAQQATELSSPSTYFDITVEDGVAQVESKATSGRKLRYNSGSPRFVFYASGQQDIWFIPAAYDSREILSLEFAETAKSLTTKNYSSFTGQAATATSGSEPVSVSLSYSWDGDEIISSLDAATGVLVLNGATGTATVSVSYTGEDYRPAEASYTITVSPASAAKWVKTDLADIAAGDTLVIVDLNTVKAMQNANGTGSAPGATAITLAAANTELNAAPAAEVRWVLEKPSASTYKFKKPGTTDYLYCTATNNGVRVGTNSNNVFSIALDGSNNPFLLNSGTNRYVGVYNSSDWRCYTSINTNINATRTAFFAKQDNTTWVLDTIYVDTPPTKTVYEVGDSFDATGMVVKATYVDEDDDEHTKEVEVDNAELTITPSGALSAGTTSVSISWNDVSTTQAITVIEWVLDGIEITTPPAKITYAVGDSFNPAGMVVNAHYIDNGGSAYTNDETLDNGDLTISPAGPYTEAGEVTVTVSYGGFSDTVEIEVVSEVTEYAITFSQPSETGCSIAVTVGGASISSGDSFEEGTVVTLEATAGSGYAFSGWTVTGATPADASAATTTFTVGPSDVSISAAFDEAKHYYVKVTSTANLAAGDYLIVYESGNVAFNGGLTSFDAVGNTISVTISNNKIEATAAVNAAKFTIATMTGGYSLQGASGNYITVNTYSNGLATSNSAAANGISFDSNGNALITVSTSGGTMTLKYNSASNQIRFRYYKNGQQNIQLYKYE